MQSVRYHAFVDPSGGSADSMSLAIGHREDDIVVLDVLREIKPPFSPESAVADFSQLLKSYDVSKITGDRYAGEWPRERFREYGINYEPAQKPKAPGRVKRGLWSAGLLAAAGLGAGLLLARLLHF